MKLGFYASGKPFSGLHVATRDTSRGPVVFVENIEPEVIFSPGNAAGTIVLRHANGGFGVRMTSDEAREMMKQLSAALVKEMKAKDLE